MSILSNAFNSNHGTLTMTTPIELPDINDPPDDDTFQEEDISYNFRELMDLLLEKKDIIITVPTDQVEILKKGLYARKSKDTYKLTKAGVKAGTDILSFLTYFYKNEDGTEDKDKTCVRVKLGARKSVTVLNIEIPDDSL